MSKYFTAKHARELAEYRKPSRSVQNILYDIEEAANDGKYYIYNYVDSAEEKELTSLGYKINRIDQEDDHCQICWDEA